MSEAPQPRGERNLATLLQHMAPQLDPQPYVFCCVDEATYAALDVVPQGLFREAEGITLVLAQAQADQSNLTYTDTWACITLTVHSDLQAIGFLDAITTKLAAARISVNVVSAYYHDHLFVPWADRDRALEALTR